MGRRSYFYSVLVIAWVFLGIYASGKLFANDTFAEVVTVVCTASVGILISFALEHVLRELSSSQKEESEDSQ